MIRLHTARLKTTNRNKTYPLHQTLHGRHRAAHSYATNAGQGVAWNTCARRSHVGGAKAYSWRAQVSLSTYSLCPFTSSTYNQHLHLVLCRVKTNLSDHACEFSTKSCIRKTTHEQHREHSSLQEVYALVDPSKLLSRERLKQSNHCRTSEEYRSYKPISVSNSAPKTPNKSLSLNSVLTGSRR